MEATNTMKVAQNHPHGQPGYSAQESAHTELEFRACRDGLDVVWIETVFYRTGKSRRTVGSLCVPREQLEQLERVIAEAKTIMFPRR